MVNLVKGQKVELTKGNAGLKKLVVGLGWDVSRYAGDSFDLDASAFMLGSDGKAHSADNFVFFNHLHDTHGSVTHLGDNLTGDGDGDDEQIVVDLEKVPGDIDKIDFLVTIYEAESRRQNFGMVSNAFVRVVDKDTGEELVRYDLSEDYSVETAMVMGELYRHNGEWKFNAIGSGFAGGLSEACHNFGI